MTGPGRQPVRFVGRGAVRPDGSAATDAWQIGACIDGRYDVEAVFAGGMGQVLRVFHREWGVHLAVKRPLLSAALTEPQRQSFLREIDAWIALGLHPHIATCHYVRDIGGVPCVFTEYADGGSLADAILAGTLRRTQPQQTVAALLEIAVQIGLGLAHAHRRHFVHQDVKPHNVLLMSDAAAGTGVRALVTDFGLARAWTRGQGADPDGQPSLGGPTATGPSSVAATCLGGTPAWCSPEQAAGEKLDARSDIWSWGIVVFELFAGRLGWRAGAAADAALAEYLAGPVALPETGVAGRPRGERPLSASCAGGSAGTAGLPIPGPLVPWLRRCLQPDRQQRFVDAGVAVEELLAAYAQICGGPFPRETGAELSPPADARNNTALSHWDLGRPDAACALWREVLADAPGHLPSVHNLALADWRAGRATDEMALARVRDAVAGDAASGDAAFGDAASALGHWCLGQIERERLDAASAERHFMQALAGDVGESARQAERDRRQDEAKQRVLNTVAEWQLPASGAGPLAGTWSGHQIMVATGPHDIHFIDTRTGLLAHTLTHTADSTAEIIAAPNGASLLVRTLSRVFLVPMPTKAGKTELRYPLHAAERAVYVPGTQRVLSWGSDGIVRVWDTMLQRCVAELKGQGARVGAAIGLDGDRVVTGGFALTVCIYRVKNAQPIAQFCVVADPKPAALENRTIEYLAPVKGGQQLLCVVSRSRFDAAGPFDVVWLDTNTGAIVQTLAARRWYTVSPDRQVAWFASEDGTVEEWSQFSGTRTATWSMPLDAGPGPVCRRFAVADFGAYAVSVECSTPQRGRLWTRAPSRCLHTLPGEVSWHGVATLPQSRLAITNGGNTVRIVDIGAVVRGDLPRASLCVARFTPAPAAVGNEKRFLGLHQEAIQNISMRDDRAALAKAAAAREVPGFARDARIVSVWNDLASRLPRQGLRGAWNRVSVDPLPKNACTPALDAAGRVLVIGGEDGRVQVLDAQKGALRFTLAGHQLPVWCVAVDPSGRWAASGGRDRHICLWDLESGKPRGILLGHTAPVKDLRFLSGSVQLFSYSEREANCWNLDKSALLFSLRADKSMFSAAISNDAQRLVTAHGDPRVARTDTAIRIWKYGVLQNHERLVGHTDLVGSLAFSPDGARLYSTAWDNTLRAWDVATGAPCWSVPQFAGVAVPTTDGRFLVGANAADTLILYDAADGQPRWKLGTPSDVIVRLALADDGLTAAFVVRNTLRIFALDWDLAPVPVRETIAAGVAPTASVAATVAVLPTAPVAATMPVLPSARPGLTPMPPSLGIDVVRAVTEKKPIASPGDQPAAPTIAVEVFAPGDAHLNQVSAPVGATVGVTPGATALATVSATVSADPVPVAGTTPGGETDRGEWQPGQRVFGEFEVVARLGAGGFGAVYRVRQVATGHELAVKRALSPDPATAQSLTRELQNWMALPAFPHLVACRFFRSLGNGLAIFAEYVPGGSLADRIAGPLYGGGRAAALAAILDIAIQTAWALAVGHQHGMVHQDVKPDNILFGGDGPGAAQRAGPAGAYATAKLTDFGIAAVARDALAVHPGLDEGATVLGASLPYQSPEQAAALVEAQQGVPRGRRRRITHKSDMWSWAVTVLEMLVGRRTWTYGQAADVVLTELDRNGLVAAGTPDAPAPRTVGVGQVPREMYDILQSVLRADPGERPADLRVVAARLVAAYVAIVGHPYPRTMPPVPRLDPGSGQLARFLTPGARMLEARYWLERLLVAAGRPASDAEVLHPEAQYRGKAGLAADVAGFAAATPIADELWHGSGPEHWPLLADFFHNKADLHFAAADQPGAVAALQRVSEIARAGRERTPGESEWLIHLAAARTAMIAVQRGRGDRAAALAAADGALGEFGLRFAKEAAPVAPPEAPLPAPEIAAALASCEIDKGDCLADLDRLPEALTWYDRGIARLEKVLTADWSEIRANNLAFGYTNKGTALYNVRRVAEALTCYDRSCAVRDEVRRRRSGAEPELRDARAWMNRANALGDLQRHAEATADYERAIALYRRLDASGEIHDARFELARALFNHGLMLQKNRDTARARTVVGEAAELCRGLVEEGGRGDLLDVYVRMVGQAGRLAAEARCGTEAIALLERATTVVERARQAGNHKIDLANHAGNLLMLAQLLRAGPERKRAVEVFATAVPLLVEGAKGPKGPRVAFGLFNECMQFGKQAIMLGQMPVAHVCFAAAVDLPRLVAGPWERPLLDESLGDARWMHGQALQALGRRDEARAVFRELIAWIDADPRRAGNNTLCSIRKDCSERLLAPG